MRTIFFDVDTQLDFLYPAGALPVPGAAGIVPSLAQLTGFATAHRIPIVSTADAHTEDDPEFKTWKPHCVAGTAGQQKSAGTLLPHPLILTTEAGALHPLSTAVLDAQQIIVEKQQLDCFSNPNLRPLLKMLKADRYVVYGVATELCVQCAAFGLLEAGAEVELVSDAIMSLNASEEHRMIRRFEAQRGRLTTLAAVIG